MRSMSRCSIINGPMGIIIMIDVCLLPHRHILFVGAKD
jgi:hypothetical protein